MKRTALSLLASVIAVTSLANPASAQLESSVPLDSNVELLTESAATVVAGDTVWLALNWTAHGSDVSDFAVVATTDQKGVEIGYPANTATHTSLMNDSVLSTKEIDFTAIQIHVPATFAERGLGFELQVTYVDANGRMVRGVREIKVPIAHYTDGDHLVQHESSETVATGGSVWVDVDMTGLAPVVEAVTLTVAGDLAVIYPAYGASTSLHHDDELEDGETDTARFRVDAVDVAPGAYELTTELIYVYAGEKFVRTGSVDIEVTP